MTGASVNLRCKDGPVGRLLPTVGQKRHLFRLRRTVGHLSVSDGQSAKIGYFGRLSHLRRTVGYFRAVLIDFGRFGGIISHLRWTDTTVGGFGVAVYVDNLKMSRRPVRGIYWWCHLMADTDAELHAMARRIGLAHSWIQRKPNMPPHYDLIATRRRAAVEAGAIEVTSRELITRVVRPWRARQSEV